MSLINYLDSAIDTIEHGAEHMHELKRKIAKTVIRHGLPATMMSNYRIVKTKNQISINALKSEKNGLVETAKNELQNGLTGKSGKAATRKCESLKRGNFTKGADSI